MLEYTANPAAKEAIARAHAERGQMMRQVWTWLFSAAKPAPRRATV